MYIQNEQGMMNRLRKRLFSKMQNNHGKADACHGYFSCPAENRCPLKKKTDTAVTESQEIPIYFVDFLHHFLLKKICDVV